ncbi:hypothetical protein EVAR_42876_1 [Eumeta japonica]|uniref:Uncharacterized protein n=1 Tax=Eumeta variegata TaxID=151549 RepID=A0A4C1YIR2_EUMVA|nr:hypothetical protein EVAR_42876_1 [Eumeta japonica]
MFLVSLSVHTCHGRKLQKLYKFAMKNYVYVLLTKACKTVSMAALPVLAGVLPLHFEVIIAGKVDTKRERLTRAKVRVLRRQVIDEMVIELQRQWDKKTKGKEL